ncbi:MAG: hypothetical protein EXR48_03390 [Dehalococcoidia bacterium]|nr:hypothetical protein [Dehalococcoidia bacterium]
MRNPQQIERALVRLGIPVTPAGQAVLEETLRKLGAPLHVHKLGEQEGAATTAYSRLSGEGLELYLPRGTSELTVIHELLHALLLTEGYLFPSVSLPDPAERAAVQSLTGILVEAVTHPLVLARMQARGTDVRLFHHVGRRTPKLPEGRAKPTPMEEVQLAASYLLQALDYPSLRAETDQEFVVTYPTVISLAREMVKAVEAALAHDVRSYRALVQGLLALADKHVQAREPGANLSLYVALAPVCTVEELARPARDLVRVTDTGVLSALSPGTDASPPPAVFLLWKQDNSTVQVRSVAHSALVAEVRERLRTLLDRPLQDLLTSMDVPFHVERTGKRAAG